MKKLLLFMPLLTLSLATSCKKHKLQRQLEGFVSSEVTIPSGMQEVFMGRDTVLIDIAGSSANMVIFIDSLSCSSCRLKYLFEYNNVLDLHAETEGKFNPVFIFALRKGLEKEIRNTLDTYRFDYPVFIDTKALFSQSNPHIPADSRFHTFLLDKNGKVVLVGDPARNPALWELYKTTIAQLIENGGTMPE